MPRADLFDVTLIIDRSDSMNSIRTSAEEGINEFLEQQKKDAGTTLVTLVQFDADYDDWYQVLADGVPARHVPRYTLTPRGRTALYDAVGRTINAIGERLAKMPERDRPGLVTVVVATDGLNNASREFTRERVCQMTEHQEKVYNWKFVYLGANQDAFAVSGAMGMAAAGAANYDPGNVARAYRAAHANVGRMKSATSRGEEAVCAFTDEERASMSADPNARAPK